MKFKPSEILPLVSACAAIAERSIKLETKCIAVQGACERVAATDLETSLVSGGFDFSQDWVLVPAGKFAAALKSIGESEAEWELLPESVTIRAKGLRYSLPLMPKGDFPVLTATDPEPEYIASIEAEPFIAALEAVAPCCATESARYTMTGICIEEGKVVATDGRRLACCDFPISEATDKFPTAVIPARVGHLLRQIFQPGQALLLHIGKNAVKFVGEGVAITTRQIEGKFPDYKAIMPRIIAHKVETNKADLVEAIRRVGFMVDTEAKKLALEFAKGSLTLSAHTQLGGDASASMDLPWDAEPMALNLDPRFLLSLLKGIEGESFVMGINSPGKPIIVTGERFQGLVMPMA